MFPRAFLLFLFLAVLLGLALATKDLTRDSDGDGLRDHVDDMDDDNDSIPDTLDEDDDGDGVLDTEVKVLVDNSMHIMYSKVQPGIWPSVKAILAFGQFFFGLLQGP